jgi:hypothetical protein
MSRLNNFLNDCKAFLTAESKSADCLDKLIELEEQLKDLQKEYTLWWEKFKLVVREACNTVINFIAAFSTQLLNYIKKVINFCTSIAGFG